MRESARYAAMSWLRIAIGSVLTFWHNVLMQRLVCYAFILILDDLVKIVWGGSQNNLTASLSSLTTANAASFNTTTPNAAGVKYFSYGSKVTLPDLVQHPLMGFLVPVTGIGGMAKGQGLENDGLVPLSSQKWGTWKGSPSYSFWVTGLDHLEVSNTLSLGEKWFDVRSFWLSMAQNAKNNQ